MKWILLGTSLVVGVAFFGAQAFAQNISETIDSPEAVAKEPEPETDRDAGPVLDAAETGDGGASEVDEQDDGVSLERQTSDVESPKEYGLAAKDTWFKRGYGVVGALFGLHSWGSWELTSLSGAEQIAYGTLEGKLFAGAHLAGYYALRSGVFHIGGGVSYLEGRWKRTQGDCCEVSSERTTLKQFSFGVTLKLGGRVGRRIWLGGALDFGPVVHLTEEWEGSSDLLTENTSDADLGVRLFPYFAADIMLLNTKGFKLGLAIAAGVVFVPGISDVESSLSDRKLSQRYLTPTISIGPMFGS